MAKEGSQRAAATRRHRQEHPCTALAAARTAASVHALGRPATQATVVVVEAAATAATAATRAAEVTEATSVVEAAAAKGGSPFATLISRVSIDSRSASTTPTCKP